MTLHPARRLDAESARNPTPTLQCGILRLYVRRRLPTRAEAGDMLGGRGATRLAAGGARGFNLDGSVRVAAHDQVGLERLLRGHRRGALVGLNRYRRHGVFAPNAAWRQQVIRYGREDTGDSGSPALAPYTSRLRT